MGEATRARNVKRVTARAFEPVNTSYGRMPWSGGAGILTRVDPAARRGSNIDLMIDHN